MLAACGDLPWAASPSSTCAKRRRNLALVLRSACSGSTFRKRAMLTTTNSRSPISPSISSRAPPSRAASSSASSSRSLSKTWSIFSQSNPAPAAFAAICWASTRAGSDRGTPASSALGLSFSVALISSQRRSTSPAVFASPSPKTCGWRRTSLLLMASIESAMSKRPSSAAICAKKTACSSRSPSSSARPSQSRASIASITS